MGLRVLVTGGTGFVGSHTAKALIRTGHHVRFLVRDRAKLEAIFDPREYGELDAVVGDMVDAAAVHQALEGCDAVVHAAALVALEAGRAEEVHRTNAQGVELVVGTAQRMGLRSIVYVSSASALYLPDSDLLEPEGPVGSNAQSPYARSKAEGERFVRKLQSEGAPIHTTYPTGILGPDDPGLSDLSRMFKLFFGTTVLITSSGFQPVDVRDLAAIHVALVEAPPSSPSGRPSRYIAAGEYMPWRELAELLDEITGTRLRRLRVSGGLMRGMGHVFDALKRVVPFEIPFTREGMTYATQWILCDASRTRDELGISFRPHAETFSDTLVWLAREGYLPADKIGRLAKHLT